ncbi:MAG: sigma-70 family RNA polymerase sigma factor [Ginsengibacter sp.]
MNESHYIEGCKKHDRLSQEKLYRQFYPALFALCRTFFDDNHEILTALNNGMLKVFRNIDQYNPGKGSFFNWVYTVVRNAALTEVRNKSTGTSLVYTESLPDTASFNPFAEKEWDDIYLLLGKLPVTTRAVCILYYNEGFSIKEVSSLLEMKEGTVKWHLNDGRNRLRKIFVPNFNKSEE